MQRLCSFMVWCASCCEKRHSKFDIKKKSGAFTWIFLRCKNTDILPQYEKKRDFDSSLKVEKYPKEVYSPEHPVNSVTNLSQKNFSNSPQILLRCSLARHFPSSFSSNVALKSTIWKRISSLWLQVIVWMWSRTWKEMGSSVCSVNLSQGKRS